MVSEGGITIGNGAEKVPLCQKNADLNLALFEASRFCFPRKILTG
jgi:hypothetical protein